MAQEKTMKIKLLKNMMYSRRVEKKGTELTVPIPKAQLFITNGSAEKVIPKAAK